MRGWTVVGADGRKAGRVLSLLADPRDDESRFFAVELDRTALQQDLDTPGGEGRITAGRYPADPNRPGARPQAEELDRFLAAGGGVVALHGTLNAWPAAGWAPGEPGPETELLLRPLPDRFVNGRAALVAFAGASVLFALALVLL